MSLEETLLAKGNICETKDTYSGEIAFARNIIQSRSYSQPIKIRFRVMVENTFSLFLLC